MAISDAHHWVALTMDIEPDWTSRWPSTCSYGLFDQPAAFERFCNMLERFAIPLTCFVVGTVLKDRPDHIRHLQKLGVEFCCHSLSHDLGAVESEREVRGGIAAFAEFFGVLPLGYRSPRSILNARLIGLLEKEGVGYDSSLIPSYRPGVYANWEKPVEPFRWGGTSLVELPIGVVKRLHVPFALSYNKLLGSAVWKGLMAGMGYSRPLVILTHPMDLVYSEEAYAQLPAHWRAAYAIRRGRSFSILEDTLAALKRNGSRFVGIREIYELARGCNLPVEASE